VPLPASSRGTPDRTDSMMKQCSGSLWRPAVQAGRVAGGAADNRRARWIQARARRKSSSIGRIRESLERAVFHRASPPPSRSSAGATPAVRARRRSSALVYHVEPTRRRTRIEKCRTLISSETHGRSAGPATDGGSPVRPARRGERRCTSMRRSLTDPSATLSIAPPCRKPPAVFCMSPGGGSSCAPTKRRSSSQTPRTSEWLHDRLRPLCDPVNGHAASASQFRVVTFMGRAAQSGGIEG
jgi:hypothetical protein